MRTSIISTALHLEYAREAAVATATDGAAGLVVWVELHRESRNSRGKL